MRAGLIQSTRVSRGHYQVVVFIDDAQITETSAPIQGAVLQACRDKFSQRRAPHSVCPAGGYILIYPVDDIDGYIEELKLKRIEWPS
ncbi:hypothetical protein SAMN05444167_1113 [Terriglobus roseus]|uniref:Uncharacterized protein n=1 Tax=Terriglobus roseus TaxID=392734 RepID=A0A1G7HKY1_9BACT|nr:hypothetical protein SAMN05444167_1113 [Terriglobus roseus]